MPTDAALPKHEGLTGPVAGTAGTNGSSPGTEFSWKPVFILWAATLGIALVNAPSTADELTRVGVAFDWWEPWLLEGTSLIVWATLIPLVAAGAIRLWPPRLTWPQTVATHLGLSLLASAVHVALMVALRETFYAAGGARYGFDWSAGNLLYEYRKDLLSYIAIAGFARLWAQLARTRPPVPAADPGFRLEVRDGARLRFLAPADIDAISAAGNYAELHLADGTTVLHRATLASLDALLAPHGFVRIHRSHLVRAAAIREISGRAAGDFLLLLAGGRQIPGSRRYREAISRLLAA